ncbi:ABC transporter substrate-binding protein [Paenibacillus piri]|nr:extracellular solute-binding protein [Paenibacillus piri]
MKTRPLVFTLLIVLCLGLLVAGCGNSGLTGQPNTNERKGDKEKIKIHVTDGFNTLPSKQFWKMFEQKFAEKYPKYNLVLENIPASDSPEQFYKTKLAAGEFPDVAKVFQPALLIDADVIQEIPQDLQNTLIDPEFGRINGKLYTMPQHQGALGMWYNKEIFKKAGIEKLPETWDEFIAACKKIQAIGIEPIGMSVKSGFFIAGHFAFLWAPATYGPEPNWPKLRTEGKVKFNNPVTRRALEQLKESMPYWQKGALSATADQVKGLFFSGKVAIMANGGIYNAAEVNTGELKAGFEIGYLTPPQDKAETRKINTYRDNMWVINKNASGEKLQAVADFLKFFYSKEIYEQFLNANAVMPTVKGFENYKPAMENPTAAKMVAEIRAAMDKHGTVAHAHAAQGDNIWPQGAREMSEKIVQELAAGNDNLDQLMNLFDEQWDKGVQQMKKK